MCGVYREWHQYREDLFTEELVKAFAIVIAKIAPAFDVNIFGIQSGLDEIVESPGMSLLKLESHRKNVIENGLCGPTCVRRHSNSGHDATLQSSDSDHEELIEIAGKNGKKVHSLQQWHIRVFGELQHTLIEGQPTELTIEVALLGEVLRVGSETVVKIIRKVPTDASTNVIGRMIRLIHG